jgi:proliferating cell nuclear antigen
MSEADGALVYLHTIQSLPLRYLIESLKEVLNDCNLVFEPTGVRIVSIDATHSTIVFVRLEAAKFEAFQCAQKVVAGVNMHSLHKLIKTITSSDTLTLWIRVDEPHQLHIKIDNKEKNVLFQSRLRLLDLDNESINIPAVRFESVIAMPSADLQRYCRDLHIVSDRIRLTSSAGTFELSAIGDFAEQTITIKERPSGQVFVPSKATTSSTGLFSLRFLNMFCKTTSLCQSVEILLKDNYPLILVYRVGDMGKLQYCLTPLEDI